MLETMREKHISACKAESIGKQTVPRAIIDIGDTLPNFNSLECARGWYTSEAQEIEAALHESLPGGTYDQLLAAMMKRKSSLFRVPLPEAANG